MKIKEEIKKRNMNKEIQERMIKKMEEKRKKNCKKN